MAKQKSSCKRAYLSGAALATKLRNISQRNDTENRVKAHVAKLLERHNREKAKHAEGQFTFYLLCDGTTVKHAY